MVDIRKEISTREARLCLLWIDDLRPNAAAQWSVRSRRGNTFIITALGISISVGGGPAVCRRKYVREEVLEQQFTELLGALVVR